MHVSVLKLFCIFTKLNKTILCNLMEWKPTWFIDNNGSHVGKRQPAKNEKGNKTKVKVAFKIVMMQKGDIQKGEFEKESNSAVS